MKLSASLSGLVAETVIRDVLEGTTDINLSTISSDNVTARAKYGSNTFPTIDSALVGVQAGNLYSKSGTSDLTFPADQAKQIARSVAVSKGTLPVVDEFNTLIDWTDSRVPATVNVHDMFEVAAFHFFVDIICNDGTTIKCSTYTRDIEIPDGYYGNLEATSSTYLASAEIMSIGEENETSEQRIDDGSGGGGLTVSHSTAGIVQAAQQKKLVNGHVLLRLCGVKDARMLFGPIRLSKLKIDRATHTVNINDKVGAVQLTLVKSWDQLVNTFGLKAAYADHNSLFPTDHFAQYTSQVVDSFTWKSRD